MQLDHTASRGAVFVAPLQIVCLSEMYCKNVLRGELYDMLFVVDDNGFRHSSRLIPGKYCSVMRAYRASQLHRREAIYQIKVPDRPAECFIPLL